MGNSVMLTLQECLCCEMLMEIVALRLQTCHRLYESLKCNCTNRIQRLTEARHLRGNNSIKCRINTRSLKHTPGCELLRMHLNSENSITKELLRILPLQVGNGNTEFISIFAECLNNYLNKHNKNSFHNHRNSENLFLRQFKSQQI